MSAAAGKIAKNPLRFNSDHWCVTFCSFWEFKDSTEAFSLIHSDNYQGQESVIVIATLTYSNLDPALCRMY